MAPVNVIESCADIRAAETDLVFNLNLRSELFTTAFTLEPKSTAHHHLAFPPLI